MTTIVEHTTHKRCAHCKKKPREHIGPKKQCFLAPTYFTPMPVGEFIELTRLQYGLKT